MNRIVQQVACLLLAAKVLSAAVPCPSPSEGCDCEDASMGYVECTGMRSLPQNLPTNVTILNLDSNPIGSVLLAMQMEKLRNLSLTQFFLSGTGIRAIEDRAFESQSNIRTLDLSDNDFRRLDGPIFFNLFHLKNLFLTKSSIHEITSIVFTYTPSLEYLDLGNNMLTRISSEFSSLSNLRTLLLQSNQISTISEQAFENQKNLLRLELPGNRLTTPEKNLFKNLVNNNGTLNLDANGQKDNPWSCCGIKAVEYQNFFNALPTNLNSRDEYNIQCSSPEKLALKTISSINLSELEMTHCNETVSSTTFGPTGNVPVTKRPVDENGNNVTTNENDDTTTGKIVLPVQPRMNVFSELTNGHIALILISLIVVVAIATAVTAHVCYARSKKRAVDDFVQNLPNSMEIDVDEDAGVTTKTYRHDAPVYGSTGKVVDRHKNGSSSSAVNYAYDTPRSTKKSTRGSPKPSPSQRRKPPPYDPPSTSPEGFDETYEQTQFNNSSSVGVDYHSYQNTNATNFYNFGYESDASDDLWDINNIR